MIKLISDKLTEMVRKNVDGIDDAKCEVINYGIYLFISDVIGKTFVILFLAHLLGIFHYAVIALVSFGALRSFAGGVHAKSPLLCLIINTSMVFGIVYISILLSFIQPVIICTLLYVFSLTVVYLYSPSDHENKPVVSRKQKRLLRTLSLIIVTITYVLSITCLSQPVSNILMLSAFSEAISILPVTYTLTRNRYGNFQSSSI